MTGASALQLTSHAAVIVGAVILWLYKDLEQSDLPDRRRSWSMNGILAFICAVYIWRGAGAPVYRAESSVGTMIAWGMAAVWMVHGIFRLGLLRREAALNHPPQLIPMSLGIATTALIALLEELLFRGGLQNEIIPLTHAMNADVYGVFAINLVFGLMHYNRGFMFAMSAGFVGTIFSIVTLASGSLLPAIVMHVGWNVTVGIARMRPHEIVETAG